jgi:hypothetical protein
VERFLSQNWWVKIKVNRIGDISRDDHVSKRLCLPTDARGTGTPDAPEMVVLATSILHGACEFFSNLPDLGQFGGNLIKARSRPNLGVVISQPVVTRHTSSLENNHRRQVKDRPHPGKHARLRQSFRATQRWVKFLGGDVDKFSSSAPITRQDFSAVSSTYANALLKNSANRAYSFS